MTVLVAAAIAWPFLAMPLALLIGQAARIADRRELTAQQDLDLAA